MCSGAAARGGGAEGGVGAAALHIIGSVYKAVWGVNGRRTYAGRAALILRVQLVTVQTGPAEGPRESRLRGCSVAAGQEQSTCRRLAAGGDDSRSGGTGALQKTSKCRAEPEVRLLGGVVGYGAACA